MWQWQRIGAWCGVVTAFIIQQFLLASAQEEEFNVNSPGHDDTAERLASALFTKELAIGTPLIFISGLLSAGGGLGGGGLYIPVFVLAVGYDPHFAVPLSKATIVGVAYGGFLVNYKRRHPLADRPLIDYDTALLLQPMLLIGTIIGVSMNVIFPGLLITVLLILLLTVVSYKTLKKGWSLYQAESIISDRVSIAGDKSITEGSMREGLLNESTKRSIVSKKSMASFVASSSIQEETFGPSDDYITKLSMDQGDIDMYEELSDNISSQGGTGILRKKSSFNVESPGKQKVSNSNGMPNPVTVENGMGLNPAGGGIEDYTKEIQQILRKESETPWLKFFVGVCVLLGILLIALFKGGASDQPSVIGVHCGTWQYWLVLVASIPYLGSITFVFARQILRQSLRKQEIGYPYVAGDIKWNQRTVIGYPAFALFAGACAGCLGIGGGLVLGPLLLEIGLYPPVVSSTSAFTIIFTSTSITTQFIILGRLPIQQGIWYCGIGFTAAIIGHHWVKSLVQRYKKVSLVSLVLGFAVGFSAAILVVTSILELAEHGLDLKFNSLCDPNAGE